MKAQLRISQLVLLVVLSLTMMAVPAVADINGTLYDNGPVNGNVKGWDITNFMVSNSFNLAAPRCPTSTCFITGWSFAVWESPGDTVTSLDWSITGAPLGAGTLYGSGTISGASLTDEFLSTNTFGFNIDEITVAGLNVNLASDLTGGGANRYWLNLTDVIVASGGTVYWDQNSGFGCGGTNGTGANCAATAFTNNPAGAGGIPTEDPDIYGYSNSETTPEPGSLTLFGSGLLGLTSVVRRRLIA